MHRLSAAFFLGYHGCDSAVANALISGSDFKPSNNDYDWLGPGIYFWEANPVRGLEFAKELRALKRGPAIATPAVVGAVIEPGLCLDLTTSAGIQHVREAHGRLVEIAATAGYPLPKNSPDPDKLRRNLDCAVITLLHQVRREAGEPPIDTVRGVFIEGQPIFGGSGFRDKTHIQICVCNPDCIKGVFRVPASQLT
ncbi:MAG: hypothetical protein AB7N54_13850 [Alphaproteobacteria bacterium]